MDPYAFKLLNRKTFHDTGVCNKLINTGIVYEHRPETREIIT